MIKGPPDPGDDPVDQHPDTDLATNTNRKLSMHCATKSPTECDKSRKMGGTDDGGLFNDLKSFSNLPSPQEPNLGRPQHEHSSTFEWWLHKFNKGSNRSRLA